MPELFKTLLSLHVLFGVAAIFIIGYLWMSLKNPDSKGIILKLLSLGGFLALLTSWMTGGYYYLYYYGTSVKPAILAGSQPWAHKLVMETKEHIFIIIPFLSITLLALIFKIDFSSPEINQDLKKSITKIAFIATTISALMAVMGFIISGAH